LLDYWSEYIRVGTVGQDIICCLPPPQFRKGKATVRDYALEELWFGRLLCAYKIRVQTDADLLADAADTAGGAGGVRTHYTEHELVLVATWYPLTPRAQENRDASNILLFEPAPEHVMYAMPAGDVLAKVPVVPAGDTGTIPPRRPFGLGAGDYGAEGRPDISRLYFVNRWAMQWATDEPIA
jgi:hypothetical protein